MCHTKLLSQSVSNRHNCHPSKHTTSCTTTVIWWQNQKPTCQNSRTPQKIHKNPTIITLVLNPTPYLSPVYLPVKTRRVTLPLFLSPNTYQRVKVSQPTPPQRVHMEFSTPKPLSYTLPVKRGEFSSDPYFGSLNIHPPLWCQWWYQRTAYF